jgi:hypothetical protein
LAAVKVKPGDSEFGDIPPNKNLNQEAQQLLTDEQPRFGYPTRFSLQSERTSKTIGK